MGDVMLIAGIDEAGIGPLAGPMTASIVVLRDGVHIEGVSDSKKMTDRSREMSIDRIFDLSEYHADAYRTNEYIDEFGAYASWNSMMAELARGAYNRFPHARYIVDGNRIIPGCSYVEPIVKADSKYLCVSAASVLAKYAQCMWMDDLHRIYPEYGFDKHRGYPTVFHKKRLEEFGPCPAHRKTYKPVRLLLGGSTVEVHKL